MQPREAWSGVQQDPHAGAAALRRSAANMPTGAGAAMMAPAQAQMMQQGRAQSANAGPGAREAAERALAARVASMVTERQQLGRPANMGGGAPGMAAGQGRPPHRNAKKSGVLRTFADQVGRHDEAENRRMRSL